MLPGQAGSGAALGFPGRSCNKLPKLRLIDMQKENGAGFSLCWSVLNGYVIGKITEKCGQVGEHIFKKR